MSKANKLSATIILDSLSGNTEEVGYIIQDTLKEQNISSTIYNIRREQNYQLIADTVGDILYLGSWTCDFGSLTPEMEDFLEFYLDECDIKAFSFGTGETQWGEENFCGAVDKLDDFLKKNHWYVQEGIKIEQYPNSENDRTMIQDWAKKSIINYKETLNEV